MRHGKLLILSLIACAAILLSCGDMYSTYMEGGSMAVLGSSPIVTAVTPATGLEPDTVSIEIAGDNFRPGAVVHLTRTGYFDIEALNIIVSETITCDIDLAGAMHGLWNVVVTNPDGLSGSLADGFEVTWPDYTVTYDGNGSTGGTVPVDGNSYIYGNTVTVLGNTGSLARTGYNFNCWNTASNGSGIDYNPGAEFTMGDSNVILYAQWEFVNFIEDWEDGAWNDTWESDITTGDSVSVQTAYYVPPGNRSLRIVDNLDWSYFDGLHYEFAGGIQPSYIGFYIRKSNDQWCRPFINIGDNNTDSNYGAIWFIWGDGNEGNDMWVPNPEAKDTTVENPAPNVFHHIEFVNIDFLTQTIDFYVDDTLITAAVPFYSPASSFTRFYISVGYYNNPAYIDNIEIEGYEF